MRYRPIAEVDTERFRRVGVAARAATPRPADLAAVRSDVATLRRACWTGSRQRSPRTGSARADREIGVLREAVAEASSGGSGRPVKGSPKAGSGKAERARPTGAPLRALLPRLDSNQQPSG